MNQVVLGFDVRFDPAAAVERQFGHDAAPVAVMTWPLTPSSHAGPPGRRLPTPKRRTSIGIG